MLKYLRRILYRLKHRHKCDRICDNCGHSEPIPTSAYPYFMPEERHCGAGHGADYTIGASGIFVSAVLKDKTCPDWIPKERSCGND